MKRIKPSIIDRMQEQHHEKRAHTASVPYASERAVQSSTVEKTRKSELVDVNTVKIEGFQIEADDDSAPKFTLYNIRVTKPHKSWTV